MAVIDLRGPGSIPDSIDRLGAAAASVVTSIKGPDAKDRRAFFKRIEENPELFDEFGKIARDNPGALKGMFTFLKDEDIEQFRKTLPSLEDLKGAAVRPAFTPAEKGGTLTPEIATALGEAARAESVGLTAPELAIQPKEVIAAGKVPQADVTAGAIRDVTGLTPGQKAKDTLTADIFNTANGIIDELEVDEKEKLALRAAIPSALFEEDRVQAQKDRIAIAQMQIDAQTLERANERTENFRRSVAARWVERTNAGTAEVWQEFLYNPDANRRARGLLDGSITAVDEGDVRLIEVATALSRESQVSKIADESAVRTQIRLLIDRIERKDSEGKFALERTVREALLLQLNGEFAELTALSEGRIPLSIGDIKERGTIGRLFGEGNQPLRIIDEGGNEIQASLPSSPATPSEEPVILNFETVDVSQLSPESRNNLLKIANDSTGELFQQLLQQAPRSAQEILNARRNR